MTNCMTNLHDLTFVGHSFPIYSVARCRKTYLLTFQTLITFLDNKLCQQQALNWISLKENFQSYYGTYILINVPFLSFLVLSRLTSHFSWFYDRFMNFKEAPLGMSFSLKDLRSGGFLFPNYQIDERPFLVFHYLSFYFFLKNKSLHLIRFGK